MSHQHLRDREELVLLGPSDALRGPPSCRQPPPAFSGSLMAVLHSGAPGLPLPMVYLPQGRAWDPLSFSINSEISEVDYFA